MTGETDVYPVDIVKAERLRSKVEAFELHRKDWNETSTTEHYINKSKSELVKLLCYASEYMFLQNAYLFDLVGEVRDLRSRMITSQEDVIKLQKDLLSCQVEKLESVQSAMTSTV